MKVKLHTIDTILILLLLLSVILPIAVAKIMVIVFFSFILLRMLSTNDIFKHAKSKILIFILLLGLHMKLTVTAMLPYIMKLLNLL